MTTPESVVRTWFDEVWNQGKETSIDRLFAADCVAHGLSNPDGSPVRGPAAFKSFFRQFRDAFPDMHIEVERTVTEGDVTAAYCHVTGAHSGKDFIRPATGKRIDFWGVAIGRVRDGQIVEAWNTFDFLTLYQQLGVIPPLA
jgi:steroid delta-isomerase-like uncharacterized protein